MEIIVQKYGGTSVANEKGRECVYQKIIEAKNRGYSPVIVVSAMGRKGDSYATDTLLSLIPGSNKREMDMIYSCGEVISASVLASNLISKGYKAISLTGQQAGIVTDNNHFDAEVKFINLSKINKYLEKGFIPVIAGSQGADENGEITTLGRGGSDVSAVVLGTALQAIKTIIYTDVEGIMTADPRMVNRAELLEKISYSSCCKLAERGAKVVHPRAVKIAEKEKQTNLYVKSTFSDCMGTYICDCENEEKGILSITKTNNYTEKSSLISLVGHKIDVLNKQKIIDYLNKKTDYRNYIVEKDGISFIVDLDVSDEIVDGLHSQIFEAKVKKCVKILA